MSRGFSRDQGVVLHHYNSGESDRIIKIFSRSSGIVIAIAPGSRKPQSRKSSHLDSLNHINFAANMRNGVNYLSQVESLQSFENIKSDLKKTRTALYLCELISGSLSDNQSEPQIYTSLLSILGYLNHSSDNYRSKLIEFQSLLIQSLGHHLPNDIAPTELPLYFEQIIERELFSPKIKIS